MEGETERVRLAGLGPAQWSDWGRFDSMVRVFASNPGNIWIDAREYEATEKLIILAR